MAVMRRLTLRADAADRMLQPRAVRRALRAGAVFLAPAPAPPALEPGPVVGWRAAAAVLGRSVDTIARRRSARGDTSEPWWASPDACRAWYATLVAPVPVQPAAPQRAARSTRVSRPSEIGAVTDYGAILRE